MQLFLRSVLLTPAELYQIVAINVACNIFIADANFDGLAENHNLWNAWPDQCHLCSGLVHSTNCTFMAHCKWYIYSCYIVTLTSEESETEKLPGLVLMFSTTKLVHCYKFLPFKPITYFSTLLVPKVLHKLNILIWKCIDTTPAPFQLHVYIGSDLNTFVAEAVPDNFVTKA